MKDYRNTSMYKNRMEMCNQDTIMEYISRQGGCITVVKLLGYPNKNGQCTVKVIEQGLLLAKKCDIIRGFNLINGVIRFVCRDTEIRKWCNVTNKWL